MDSRIEPSAESGGRGDPAKEDVGEKKKPLLLPDDISDINDGVDIAEQVEAGESKTISCRF